MLIFKRKELKKDPLPILKKTLQAWLRSVLSMTAFSFIGRLFMCYIKRVFGEQTGSKIFWFNGICATALFIEKSNRWPEFAMNIFPRLIESWPVYLRKQGLFPRGRIAR